MDPVISPQCEGSSCAATPQEEFSPEFFSCPLYIRKHKITVFGAGDDDGQLWMEADTRHVLSMSFQCLDTGFILKERKHSATF